MTRKYVEFGGERGCMKSTCRILKVKTNEKFPGRYILKKYVRIYPILIAYYFIGELFYLTLILFISCIFL